MAAKAKDSDNKNGLKLGIAIGMFVVAGGIYYFMTRESRPTFAPGSSAPVTLGGGDAAAAKAPQPGTSISSADPNDPDPEEQPEMKNTTGTRALNPDAPPPEEEPEPENPGR